MGKKNPYGGEEKYRTTDFGPYPKRRPFTKKEASFRLEDTIPGRGVEGEANKIQSQMDEAGRAAARARLPFKKRK